MTAQRPHAKVSLKPRMLCDRESGRLKWKGRGWWRTISVVDVAVHRAEAFAGHEHAAARHLAPQRRLPLRRRVGLLKRDERD